MYKVSIGIPVYNVAAYVERALLSALNQTLPDIEYIIVDDRGTDNSMDIVRRMIAAHPRGKDARIIVHEVNGGPGVARDTMMANATAPYIYFMDSDDELTEDAIALLYNTMSASGGAQVVGGSHAYIPLGGCSPEPLDRAGQQYRKEGAEIIHAYGALFPFFAWNKLYDLDFLKKEKIGFGGLRFYEDIYFSMSVACKANRCIYITDITYFYYEVATSITSCYREKRYDANRCKSSLVFQAKLLDLGFSLEGDVRLFFEQKILEMLYGENRFVLRSSGLTDDEKRVYLGDLDALWRAYPFTGKYRSLKGKFFWVIFKMPMPLRIVLLQIRNRLMLKTVLKNIRDIGKH